MVAKNKKNWKNDVTKKIITSQNKKGRQKAKTTHSKKWRVNTYTRPKH